MVERADAQGFKKFELRLIFFLFLFKHSYLVLILLMCT